MTFATAQLAGPLPRAQVQERLVQLNEEFERGRHVLADLETRQAQLRESLLRIGGAIQVLEELLADQGTAAVDAAAGD